jgi:hypothetical protein
MESPEGLIHIGMMRLEVEAKMGVKKMAAYFAIYKPSLQ